MRDPRWDLDDRALIARRPCTLDSVTCAPPAYLAAHGVPTHPEDIRTQHLAISYLFPLTGKTQPMRFSKGAEAYEIRPKSAVNVRECTAQHSAILAGLGIGQIFGFTARPHFAEGHVVSLLEDWAQPTLPIHPVYPATRHPSGKLRVFADWAVETFGRLSLRDGQQTG